MSIAANQLRTLIFALADDYTEVALKVDTSGLPEVYTRREITEKRDEMVSLVDDLDGNLAEASSERGFTRDELNQALEMNKTLQEALDKADAERESRQKEHIAS